MLLSYNNIATAPIYVHQAQAIHQGLTTGRKLAWQEEQGYNRKPTGNQGNHQGGHLGMMQFVLSVR